MGALDDLYAWADERRAAEECLERALLCRAHEMHALLQRLVAGESGALDDADALLVDIEEACK